MIGGKKKKKRGKKAFGETKTDALLPVTRPKSMVRKRKR